MEAERPKQRKWNEADDPVNHCLAGNSLLLTGLRLHASQESAKNASKAACAPASTQTASSISMTMQPSIGCG